ncbi:peptide chain release factor N(5)-glutamine methyltransferase [Thermosipho ferrireducens]|uniref:peptide chain release factor N(5)-glutamine methyltransferase n=1 Tax=Thermosipho ferrireducens TaxID=2571116 RepID=A0ABX7S5M4_9BACT|nr:HemK/PrmC family methyltransferase [Thermosipho ferrireducens]QTA37854.1 peptide chain release factor N(5)-glutamine methyltransferase [Thermosipho ferrireducens]
MKIGEAIKISKRMGLPETEALILLSYLSGNSKEYLLSHLEEECNEKFFLFVKKRLSGYPLHYIIKKKHFFKGEFYVEEGVFIPRFETEGLVELAIDIIKRRKIGTIAEIGVGSGAVSVSILCETNVRALGTDVSEKAIKVTRLNASNFGVESRIDLRKGRFLEPFRSEYKNIELIISNPPYVRQGAILPEDVTFEPPEALFGGEDGLYFYKEFFKLYDTSGKIVLMEIGDDQGEYFRKQNITVLKDYSGKDRYILVE